MNVNKTTLVQAGAAEPALPDRRRSAPLGAAQYAKRQAWGPHEYRPETLEDRAVGLLFVR